MKSELGNQKQKKGSESMNEYVKFETNERTELTERKGILTLIRSNSRSDRNWAKVEDRWGGDKCR